VPASFSSATAHEADGASKKVEGVAKMERVYVPPMLVAAGSFREATEAIILPGNDVFMFVDIA
jgi:hypothetical protein